MIRGQLTEVDPPEPLSSESVSRHYLTVYSTLSTRNARDIDCTATFTENRASSCNRVACPQFSLETRSKALNFIYTDSLTSQFELDVRVSNTLLGAPGSNLYPGTHRAASLASFNTELFASYSRASDVMYQFAVSSSIAPHHKPDAPALELAFQTLENAFWS